MRELVHNDVHAHQLERSDRQPAGQQLLNTFVQSHRHAETDQPVGDNATEEGQEEAKASKGFVLLLNVDLIQSNDLLAIRSQIGGPMLSRRYPSCRW